MVEDFDSILAILDKLIAKFSSTRVEVFDAILAILVKLIENFLQTWSRIWTQCVQWYL